MSTIGQEGEVRMDDISQLKSLGTSGTQYRTGSGVDPSVLETFPNKGLFGGYTVKHSTDEFTSLCPKTGQPDFGKIEIEMVPLDLCIESKSLKLYLGSYRSEGAFMETMVNRILADLWAKCPCKFIRVTGTFKGRGGIQTTVDICKYEETKST